MAKVMDKAWERMQKKTFTKWVNMHLAKRGKGLDDILTGFQDGTLLASLLEVLTGDSVGKIRPAEKCKMSIHKTENINQCLKYITDVKGVRLLNIGASNINEGHPMLTLALVWMMILHLDVDELSAEELNAKEALLLWCRKKTEGYNHVDPPGVKNFHTSWKNGMAFCALLHRHKPGMIDYDSLDPNNDAENLEKAFAAAEELGIARFLDVEDMVETERPDDKSVMTYLFQWYRYFAAGNKSETAARRIAKLVSFRKMIQALQDDYSVKSAAWAAWTKGKTEEFLATQPANTVEAVRELIATFSDYSKNEKPPKASEKTELEVLLSSIQLKLKNAGRAAFQPEHSAADIRNLWKALLDAERSLGSNLKSELKRQQTLIDLVKRFNRLHNKLTAFEADKKQYLDKVEQIDSLNAAQSKLQLHQSFFSDLESSNKTLAKAKDLAAKIDELNYAEKDDVNARAAALQAASEGLKAGGDAKQQRLEEAVAREERKNVLRKEFAQVAKDAKDFYKATTLSVTTAGFGNTLQAVRDAKANLDAEAADITSKADAQKGGVAAKDAELSEAGITENEYTVVTVADIDAAHDALLAKLQTRQANYESELAAAEALDSKRREFADAANKLNEFVQAKQAEIDASEGTEDEKIAATQAIWNNGSEAQSMLEAVKALDAETKGMMTGSTNEHSQFTVDDLSRLVDTFNSRAQNAISTCEENKQYATRTAEQDEQRAARAAAEKASVEFATLANTLANWIASVDDNIGEDLSSANSMEQVDAQEVLYNQSNGELAENQGKLDTLTANAAAMTEAGNTDFGTLSLEDVTAKFQAVSAALGERAAAIEEAKTKQTADEEVRTAFVAALNAINDFLQDNKAAVAADGAGSLDEQLEAANALLAAKNTTGIEKMDAARAASEALTGAGINADDKTDLTVEGISAEFESLGDAIKNKMSVLQQEIAAKDASGIPPEKIAEFQEVFDHFDKNQNGVLSHLEFIGCLKSLGEDRTDAEFTDICNRVDTDGNGVIDFKNFSDFMISVTEDRDTEDEIVEAFKVLTSNGDFITEEQVRQVMKPEEADYLLSQMPQVEGGYDYKSWTAAAYGN